MKNPFEWPEWTNAEKKFIVDHRLEMIHRDIGTQIGRTHNAVRSRASIIHALKLETRKWSKEEIEFLCEWYPSKGSEFVAKALRRTIPSVNGEATRQKLRMDRPRWTPEYLAILKNEYPTLGALSLAKKLPFTVSGIRRKAFEMGFTERKIIAWGEHEFAFLHQWYPVYGKEYVAAALHRTVSSVQHKARIMHILPPHPRIPWTSEDNEYLKRWYLRRGGEFVARALSRKRNAIEEQARKLGITRDDLRSWTEAENEVIRKFGATHSASELGLQLRRHPSSIRRRAKQLGIRLRNPESMSKREVEYLLKNYQSMRLADLASAFGKKQHTIEYFLRSRRLLKQIQVRYSEHEKQIVRRMYGNASVQIIAETLEITKKRVWKIVGALKLAPPRKFWTPEQIAMLQREYPRQLIPKLVPLLGHSAGEIRHKADTLGLHAARLLIPWSSREDELLRRDGAVKTADEFAALFGRTRAAVKTHSHSLGVHLRNPYALTDREQKYIKENFIIMTNRELAEDIGCPSWKIKAFLKKIKLRRK